MRLFGIYLVVPENPEKLNDFIVFRDRITHKQIDFRLRTALLSPKNCLINSVSLSEIRYPFAPTE